MNRKQRHLGRQLALQWLFEIDVGEQPVDDALASVSDDLEGVDEEGVTYARQLVLGVQLERRNIDEVIEKYSKGWTIARMPGVDRNLLRIAVYEIRYLPDVPAGVTVDEAVEIAKSYGTEDSGKFINGILGTFLRSEYGKPEIA